MEIEVYPDLFLNGVDYKAVKEVGSLNCSGCIFNPDEDGCINSCDEAVRNLDCSEYGIVWIKKTEVQINLTKSADMQEGYKLDDAKLQYSLIPPLALEALARNLTAGLSKYPKDNWKKVENAEQRYMDALYRHLEAHRKGELYDSESSAESMLHLAAVAVNAMFLIEFILNPEMKPKTKA